MYVQIECIARGDIGLYLRMVVPISMIVGLLILYSKNVLGL